MTPEIIAIVTMGVALAGVGAALAGMILTSIRGVQQDINELRGEVGTLRERMAHLEGVAPRLNQLFGNGKEPFGEPA